MLRAIAPPRGAPLVQALQIACGLPRLALEFKDVVTAIYEVGGRLTERLDLPPAVSGLFAYVGDRWDGKGDPEGVEGDEIPLPVRIVHVAQDAAFQPGSRVSRSHPSKVSHAHRSLDMHVIALV